MIQQRPHTQREIKQLKQVLKDINKKQRKDFPNNPEEIKEVELPDEEDDDSSSDSDDEIDYDTFLGGQLLRIKSQGYIKIKLIWADFEKIKNIFFQLLANIVMLFFHNLILAITNNVDDEYGLFCFDYDKNNTLINNTFGNNTIDNNTFSYNTFCNNTRTNQTYDCNLICKDFNPKRFSNKIYAYLIKLFFSISVCLLNLVTIKDVKYILSFYISGEVSIIIVDLLIYEVDDTTLNFTSMLFTVVTIGYLIKKGNFFYAFLLANLIIILTIYFSIKLSLYLENRFLIVILPIINFTLCIIQKSLLSHPIGKYFSPISKFYLFYLRNALNEFFMAGFYMNIFSGTEVFPLILIIFFDIFCIVVRKLKISERIVLHIWNKLTEQDYAVEFNDLDHLNEVCYIESTGFTFFYIMIVFIFNSIHNLDKHMDIIDCKGTPNPIYFTIGEVTVTTFFYLFIIRFLVYFICEIYNFEFDNYLKYPIFESNETIFTKFVSIHMINLIRGTNLFSMGLYSTKLFRN